MKLKNQYTINVDDEAKTMIEYLAKHYNRKPAELLRLLLDEPLRVATVQASNIASDWKNAKFK